MIVNGHLITNGVNYVSESSSWVDVKPNWILVEAKTLGYLDITGPDGTRTVVEYKEQPKAWYQFKAMPSEVWRQAETLVEMMCAGFNPALYSEPFHILVELNSAGEDRWLVEQNQ